MRFARQPFRSIAVALVAVLAAASVYGATQGFGGGSRDVSFAAPTAGMRAAEPRPPIFGPTIHFGMADTRGYVSDATVGRQLDEMGADSYRDGIVWSSFAFPPGRPPVMRERRRIMDFIPEDRRSPLLVLGAPGIEPATEGAPFTDAQLRQFAAYAGVTAAMTRSRKPIFEMWNEFNLKVGHQYPGARLKGEGDPSDPRAAVHYARLAQIGTKAVKAAAPEATVLVGAAGDDTDWLWTKAIVREGAMDGADGLSVHLYNHCLRTGKRTADEMIDRLVILQDALRGMNGGRDVPIHVSEFGWPTLEGKCGVSPDRAAANYAQFILEAGAYSWLRGLWPYELKDSGTDPDDIEHNFGLFTYDDRPKPAVCFAQQAIDFVRAARSIEIERPAPGVFVMRAVMEDHQVLGLWTDQPDETRRASVSPSSARARRMCGEESGGADEVSVSIVPVLLRYPPDATIDVRVEP